MGKIVNDIFGNKLHVQITFTSVLKGLKNGENCE